MKVPGLLALLLVLLTLTPALSDNLQNEQNDDQTTFSVTVYPLMAVAKWYSLEAELSLNNHISFAVETKYIIVKSPFTSNNKSETTCAVLGYGLRFYPQVVQEGFFLATYFESIFTHKTRADQTSPTNSYSYGAAVWIGNRWLFSHCTLELSAGYGLMKDDTSCSATRGRSGSWESVWGPDSRSDIAECPEHDRI